MQRRTSAVAAVALATICGLLWQAAPASQQAGWQVSDLDTGQVEAPDIAVDTRGNVLAVWSKQQRVFTSTYSIAGGKWTAAIMLSNALDFSSEPQVASNASGAAIAVWRGVRSSDATPYVGLSRFSAATQIWSQAAELSTNGYWPRAVIDTHGNTTVIWAEWLREELDYYYYPYPIFEIRSIRDEACLANSRSGACWFPLTGSVDELECRFQIAGHSRNRV